MKSQTAFAILACVSAACAIPVYSVEATGTDVNGTLVFPGPAITAVTKDSKRSDVVSVDANTPEELFKRASSSHCQTSGGSPALGDVLSIASYLSNLPSSQLCGVSRPQGSTASACVQMAYAGTAGSDLCFVGWAGGYNNVAFNCNKMGVYLRNMANTCAWNGLTGGYQEINPWDYVYTGGGNQGQPTGNEVTINMYHV